MEANAVVGSPQLLEATGRRKTAAARVRLSPGTGNIVVNERPVEGYFPTEALRRYIVQPFDLLGLKDQFDVQVSVSGGGLSGQAGAIRHGIARALALKDAQTRAALKAAGLLTRDARMKERKKAGQPGARRRFQFSKR